jgi:predicted DNA-binding transcriptional regulator YafY
MTHSVSKFSAFRLIIAAQLFKETDPIMNRTERLYKIDKMLRERKVVAVNVFVQELGVSLATFKRDLEYLRDRMNAPVVWDRDAGGYRFDKQGVGDAYELPGLWFSASEIHALLTMQQLLSSLGPGLLTPHVEPLLGRLRSLLDQEGLSADPLQQRIRIEKVSARSYEPDHFVPIATTVIQRRKIAIHHHNRNRNEVIRREVSPQRLRHYRENWYLDAWCHLRNELRSFGLDAVQGVELLDEAAVEMDPREVEAEMDSGYGAFTGKEVELAVLEFTAPRAQWVSKETWHPRQQSEFTTEGNYRLTLPYSKPQELVMDILRHVPHVKVIEPESLRLQVQQELQKALKHI